MAQIGEPRHRRMARRSAALDKLLRPITQDRHGPFGIFVTVVLLGGLGAFAAVGQGWHEVEVDPKVAVGLAGLLLITELMPVSLPYGGANVEVATSTAFTLAMLFSLGIGPTLVAQLAASLASDIRQHKHALKTAFNLAQFSIAVVASGEVLAQLGKYPPITGGLLNATQLGPMLMAAVVFLAVNDCLVWTVVSLATGGSLRRRIAAEWFFETASGLALAGLTPVIAFIAINALPLLPLLLIPVAAVYTTGRAAIAQAHQASHDILTGLANRTRFRAETEEALKPSGAKTRSVALVVIDLDRFKEINNTLGHHIGDLLLSQIGPRLAAGADRVSLVARVGGDEFAVLLTDIEDGSEAVQIAGKLALALERPFVLADGLMVDLEASIGVTVSPDHGDNVDILLQRADVAMYLAKASRSGIELYAPERDDNTLRRLTLIGQLRTAITNHELTVYYQPKLSVETQEFCAVEALVRWFHPDLGNVTPDEFIPLAERSGLIKPLTRYVMETAINQAQEWRRRGLPLRVAVNLSARSLLDEDLPSMVATLLAEADMDPSTLELEITETELMGDPVRGAKVLERIHAMGVRLTIDDFGTGYSSLAYLRSLPVDEIKIDRCFVTAMGENLAGADIIVKATIDLARNLGLEITAEGVENVGQLDQLVLLGCHFLQGFYLSRPLPPEKLYALLATSPIPVPASPVAGAIV
jgi:diguanylate cyclase (GGDEF)-like protein